MSLLPNFQGHLSLKSRNLLFLKVGAPRRSWPAARTKNEDYLDPEGPSSPYYRTLSKTILGALGKDVKVLSVELPEYLSFQSSRIGPALSLWPLRL